MELSIIQIGNSKGLRLPKSVLEKYSIGSSNKVELILEDNQFIVKPISEPRKGWDEAFKQMNANGDDQPLMGDLFDDETFDEW